MHLTSNQNSNSLNTRTNRWKWTHGKHQELLDYKPPEHQPWDARRLCCQSNSLFAPEIHWYVTSLLPGTCWYQFFLLFYFFFPLKSSQFCAISPCLLHAQWEQTGEDAAWWQSSHPTQTQLQQDWSCSPTRSHPTIAWSSLTAANIILSQC